MHAASGVTFLNRHKKRQPRVLKQPSYGVKNYNSEKVRMLQKMLNTFVGAKYITILRTW